MQDLVILYEISQGILSDIFEKIPGGTSVANF